jgi:hypothetical protein
MHGFVCARARWVGGANRKVWYAWVCVCPREVGRRSLTASKAGKMCRGCWAHSKGVGGSGDPLRCAQNDCAAGLAWRQGVLRQLRWLQRSLLAATGCKEQYCATAAHPAAAYLLPCNARSRLWSHRATTSSHDSTSSMSTNSPTAHPLCSMQSALRRVTGKCIACPLAYVLQHTRANALYRRHAQQHTVPRSWGRPCGRPGGMR